MGWPVVCMYVCMYVWLDGWLYVCVCVCMYVCMYVLMDEWQDPMGSSWIYNKFAPEKDPQLTETLCVLLGFLLLHFIIFHFILFSFDLILFDSFCNTSHTLHLPPHLTLTLTNYHTIADAPPVTHALPRRTLPPHPPSP